ncbi:chemotaxis protein CheW [Stenotrophomonas rhizophila]|uniref:chemotaxis protein CheW n=1 Tax=Stenotrophomonas rhizophila TaxID=216778 RepID=UPI0010C06083|nr:chemotaxis protein CheW [Stenotrophomonas rhizophila]TKK09489.1 chemotaxis protein CheW [Stenotrophomonas rhizophila]
MNTAGVLDDYLEQLLGDAVPAAPVQADVSTPPTAAVAAQDDAEADGVARAISAEFARHALADAGTDPDSDAPAPAAQFDTPTAAGAPANLALLDELMNDPALGPPVETLATVHDTPTSPGAPANLALLDELMNDPALGPPVETLATVHDTPTSPGAPANLALLDELMNDPALGPPVAALPAAAAGTDAARPSWDDLPDDVLHDNAPAIAAVAAPVAPARPAPAPTPTARAMPAPMPMSAPSARSAAPTPAHTRPGSWQELQAQARNPASSPRENRRASERTSRWLRLRCGAQAYALELLKVQEVVLPVPLLPLRGTADAMLGIMNLRGQVVPVMDLGIHLGAGPAQEDANTRIVVLEEDGETMGLRVSAVEDVANLTDSQIEPPDTARICQISNDLFRGVARISAQPMILLDATQLLN